MPLVRPVWINAAARRLPQGWPRSWLASASAHPNRLDKCSIGVPNTTTDTPTRDCGFVYSSIFVRCRLAHAVEMREHTLLRHSRGVESIAHYLQGVNGYGRVFGGLRVLRPS
ncbi:hypothetical protein SBBP2_70017 [Burkholderiales bacterium]|nr:hypothetical protein SBBP2_70017 [Burkholderiales bacterium]